MLESIEKELQIGGVTPHFNFGKRRTLEERERMSAIQRKRYYKPAIERILERTELVRNGCAEWQGTLIRGTYGTIGDRGKRPLCHRVTYEHYKGPIPKGLLVDHMCMNKKCVNPSHLRLVDSRTSNLENTNGMGAKNSKKTHCPKGHPYSKENTYRYFREYGWTRECKICKNKPKNGNKRY